MIVFTLQLTLALIVVVLMSSSSSAFVFSSSNLKTAASNCNVKSVNVQSKLGYKKSSEDTMESVTDDSIIDAHSTLLWDSTNAVDQINDLERMNNGDDDVSVDVDTNISSTATTILPAQTIIHKHNHIIFRPTLREDALTTTTANLNERDENMSTSQTQYLQQQTAFVFVPGAFLDPLQYEALALAIQEQSTHPIWIVVPKLFLNAANPLSIPYAMKECIQGLQSSGYPLQNKIFIGGHSLGGTFLPQILEQLDPRDLNNIAGMILLGSFVERKHRKNKNAAYRSIPRLTVVGDLDGVVRAARIAEDIEHHVHVDVSRTEDSDEARFDHSVVMIKGMNHFQLVDTNIVHKICQSRDLQPEISKEDATQSTACAIVDFVESHHTQVKDKNQKERRESLLEKIRLTEKYLEPLLQAMRLEGNYNIVTPCNLVECDVSDNEATCNKGSSWVESIQEGIVPEEINEATVRDEFRRTWYINPFAKIPFYHPSVTNNNCKVNIETVTEGIYEKADFFIDAGFFSNTAIELRSKLNSNQAILNAIGVSIPFESNQNTCSEINQMTIQYALENAPDIVKKRYMDQGIKLQAGVDISHNNGPTWIWSHLDFTKEGDCGTDEPCRIIDSHTMNTPIDHPVPFAGGKLYCKLLSPAKVLDWMYTDSLR